LFHRSARGPLAHLKVIELGSFIAGPYCGQLLADLGADVIKIEPPRTGDTMRTWGASKTPDGKSLWWSVIARNKRCLTLDLRRPEGQGLVRRLTREADVLLENFRPGTLERWNLSPDLLCKENDQLIVARVSGFGQSGPYRNRAGFGAVAESVSGLRYLTGYPDRAPTRVGISIGDSLAGLFATIGILSSLIARQGHFGRGQTVDVAITESILAVMESVIPEYAATGAVRQRSGAILPGIAPSNLYPTLDGSYVLIAANADKLFATLAEVMGRPELASDPCYATHIARGERQGELDEIVGDWTATRPAREILDLMEQHGIPAGPVNDAASIAADPHFRERQAIIEVPHDELGGITMQGAFPKLSGTPAKVRWAGSDLGEHTDEILRDRLGCSDSEICRLRSEGIV